MQFGFRFKILLFSTSVRFSTRTLAYLAYKAFIAFKAYKTFKRSRLDQSVPKIPLEVKLQVIVNQKRDTSIAKTTTPEQIQSG